MLNEISSYLWIVTTIIVIISAIYLLLYNNFAPLKVFNKCKLNSKESIKLLNLSLAGKIGVGSISGVAISIIIGGIGTIFWIWISTIFLSIFTYLEVKTGIIYREKRNNITIGGAQVFLKNVLNKKYLSYFYSLLIIITFLFSFILIQSNTIIISISNNFNFNKYFILFVLLLIVYLSINKGINSISKIVNKLVPLMGILYILIGLIIIIKNITSIPNLLNQIVMDGLNIKSIISLPIIIGFQRSIFSNESGMGTTSLVVSLSKENDYKKEASYQIIGNCFITLVICTVSSILILTTNYNELNIVNINGIEIINYAFKYNFGNIGDYLSTLIISLFCFSTIITSYYYGDITIKYLFNKKSAFSKIIVIIVIILSLFIKPFYIWSIVDIFVAITTLINIYGLIKIRKLLRGD